MIRKVFFAVTAAVLAMGLTACVNTVEGGKTPGVPFVRDSFEGRYDRPLDQCFESAKEAIAAKGQLVSDSTLHGQTNVVKTVMGRVNQRTVWVRVEALQPRVTSVIVQARTAGGTTDLPLTHEIEKDIALRLTTR
jgi:hypothetical protein